MVMIGRDKLVLDDDDTTRSKIPWKQIAREIANWGFTDRQLKVHSENLAQSRKILSKPRSKILGLVGPYLFRLYAFNLTQRKHLHIILELRHVRIGKVCSKEALWAVATR